MTSIPAKAPAPSRTIDARPTAKNVETSPAPEAPGADAFLASPARPETVEVAGAQLPRLDKAASRTWEGTFGHRALEAAYSLYDKSRVTGWIHRLFERHDTDTPEEVQRALSTPPPLDANGQPKSFGDVTVVVNGMLNLVSTPAAMFRIAANTRGPLVIASSNPSGTDGYRLRPLEELWGTPVPPELRGKLFAIGDLSPNMIPWPQASDLFLEHLSVIDRQFGTLKSSNPALQSMPALRDAEVTVLGYSQGALSVAAARKRLVDAGRGALIDRVVSVAGSFEGTILADDTPSNASANPLLAIAAKALTRVFEQLNRADGYRMFDAMDPDYVAAMKDTLGLTPELVDVAYQASTDAGGGKRWLEPFFALSSKLMGGTNDGVIDSENPFGSRIVRDEVAKTHLVSWKDFRTFDRILEAL